MTDEYAGLLRSVRERPEDDQPRLVYADWLDENGQPERAAWIRWAVANPQNSAVCLCLNGRRQPQPCETCQLLGDEIAVIPRRPDGETPYVANRGWVAEIRCPLAVLTGGPCGRCVGEGRTDQHWDPASDTMRGGTRCPACKVTGRVEGIAPALFAAHPVTRVVTDREPYKSESRDLWGYFGRTHNDDGPASPRDSLTAEVFRLLDGGRAEANIRWYSTRQAALDALSDAIVAWGRTLAGLPALEGSSGRF